MEALEICLSVYLTICLVISGLGPYSQKIMFCQLQSEHREQLLNIGNLTRRDTFLMYRRITDGIIRYSLISFAKPRITQQIILSVSTRLPFTLFFIPKVSILQNPFNLSDVKPNITTHTFIYVCIYVIFL